MAEERIEATRLIPEPERSGGKTHVSAQDDLSMAGKLWNFTYIIRAGRYFVRELSRLTNPHKIAEAKKRTKRVVRLG